MRNAIVITTWALCLAMAPAFTPLSHRAHGAYGGGRSYRFQRMHTMPRTSDVARRDRDRDRQRQSGLKAEASGVSAEEPLNEISVKNINSETSPDSFVAVDDAADVSFGPPPESTGTAVPPPLPPPSSTTPMGSSTSGTAADANAVDSFFTERWEELNGNFVLRPPPDQPARALIHFLGGAFVGAAPHVT